MLKVLIHEQNNIGPLICLHHFVLVLLLLLLILRWLNNKVRLLPSKTH